ncbi:hypothetical protein [Nocardioides sp. 1609]|uniref:hypothetical protein n=1 Tax=Nocardioides sp. 1609 TaxID=2508327 RepID=UPI00106F6C41|nr:hypothetical protein [Nocardioides sp. 1609]
MSANDWHVHAARVRPLHPVPAPRAVAAPTSSDTPVLDGLADELTALTRVLLGLGADLPAAPAAPEDRVVVDTEPTPWLPRPAEPALVLAPPVEAEPVVVPEPVFVAQPIVEVEPLVLPDLAFVPQPVVEVEPLVPVAPVPTTLPDDAWPAIVSLAVAETEPPAPEPEPEPEPEPARPRVVRLDDLAFLDL